MKKTQLRFIIFLVLAVIVLMFIFGNSLKSGEESNKISTGVMEFILGVIDPAGKIDTKVAHVFVRKAAHFVEFMLYGMCLCGMALAVLEEKKKMYAALTLFVALFSAVIDEVIQGFTSRTSSPRDILLDFCGSVFGVIIEFAVGNAVMKHRAAKKERKTKRK